MRTPTKYLIGFWVAAICIASLFIAICVVDYFIILWGILFIACSVLIVLGVFAAHDVSLWIWGKGIEKEGRR